MAQDHETFDPRRATDPAATKRRGPGGRASSRRIDDDEGRARTPLRPVTAYRPLYRPRARDPMRVVFFSSGGPGNLQAVFDVEERFPALVRVEAVVADRPGIPSLDLARSQGRPTVVRDFSRLCGPPSSEDYRFRRQAAHDEILDELTVIERQQGFRFDLAVLGYRRIIEGPLFARFGDAMINQHPADLTIRAPDGRRRYTGIGGLAAALADGQPATRTSTIVVAPGIDAGEIISQGPSVSVSGLPLPQHEALQKKVSDWPSLRFAVETIAKGELALATGLTHDDGSRVVVFRGAPQGYGGVDLDRCSVGEPLREGVR